MRVLDACDLPDSVVDAWSELQLAEPTLASPFLRPEFTTIVAAARAHVHVAVLEGGGFFPFQRGRLGAGLPVGSRLSDYQGLVAPPDTNVRATKLLEECSLSTWEFDGVVAKQEAFRPYHQLTRDSPIIDVGAGYEAYAASRAEVGSAVLEDAARASKRLARDVGPLRFEPHVADAKTLQLLLEWKAAQYARTGAFDIFELEWVRDVVRRAHGAASPTFGGMLSVLFAAGEPVAAHLGLRSATIWHSWLPAYDPARARYSPGIILLVEMAKTASELGLRAIDLGKGDAFYKSRLANSAVTVASGVVERPSLAAVTGRLERLGTAVLHRTPARDAASRAATRRRLR
jgi:CelD/BcsL family acetyltransferase involved in cellulose biosynthesis